MRPWHPITSTAPGSSSRSASGFRPSSISNGCPGRSSSPAFPRARTSESPPENREGTLVQAADLLGQLGDPLYLKKANALFHEFSEIGLNAQRGYASPADLVEDYPDFYWSHVSPYLKEAIGYLNVTADGSAVDREPVQPRVLRRTRPRPHGAAAIKADAASAFLGTPYR